MLTWELALPLPVTSAEIRLVVLAWRSRTNKSSMPLVSKLHTLFASLLNRTNRPSGVCCGWYDWLSGNPPVWLTLTSRVAPSVPSGLSLRTNTSDTLFVSPETSSGSALCQTTCAPPSAVVIAEAFRLASWLSRLLSNRAETMTVLPVVRSVKNTSA
jgi:hypothetical protein